MYEYKFTVQRVIDGDTVDGEIDLGFSITIHKRVRLFGINAPETRTKDEAEKARGLRTKEWLIKKVEGKAIRLKTEKDNTGKYGRILGTLLIDDLDINLLMLNLGLVDEYE